MTIDIKDIGNIESNYINFTEPDIGDDLEERRDFGINDEDDDEIEDEFEGDYKQCPNCGSIWGCEEYDFQECDCCGWPDIDDNEDDDELDYEAIS